MRLRPTDGIEAVVENLIVCEWHDGRRQPPWVEITFLPCGAGWKVGIHGDFANGWVRYGGAESTESLLRALERLMEMSQNDTLKSRWEGLVEFDDSEDSDG